MIINNYCTEVGALSYNHVGEQLCGDHYQIVKPDENTLVVVLADGLGSGVKASILSTLTSEIISTMMAHNLSIEECVETIAETLPVCKERGIAYSTFTILKISQNRYVQIYNFDNPELILLRNGKEKIIPSSMIELCGKKIYRSEIEADLYDVFILLSDGTIHAGLGQSMNFGWERPQIIDYISALYNKDYSSKSLATELVSHCNDLYGNKPGDDTTAVVLRIRKRCQVNLLIGPASNVDDNVKMLSLFFSKEGKHIVCGGSTSNMVAEYLHKPLVMDTEYIDKEIPPTSFLEGVDLVTEGVITINKVLAYAKNSLQNNQDYFQWCFKQDGASKIARILFEEATDINFFVGCAVNPAHQQPGVKMNFTIKMQLIDELAKTLKDMGKRIKVSYF
jgi:hypothetical protein